MRKSFGPRKRHVVDMFATICWFHALRNSFDAASVAAVQRGVEPVSEERAHSVRRRWRGYKDGIHSPRAHVLSLSDSRCPEAVEIFKSPLWDALRLDRNTNHIAQSLLRATSRSGDELILRMISLDQQQSSYVDERWLRKRCADMLRQGSLEGLAVLVICMRLAASKDSNRIALTFYRYAGYCLLTLGIWFYDRGIAQGIAEYFESDLLHVCGDKAYLGNFSSVHYLSRIRRMAAELTRAHSASTTGLTFDEEIQHLIRWLDL